MNSTPSPSLAPVTAPENHPAVAPQSAPTEATSSPSPGKGGGATYAWAAVAAALVLAAGWYFVTRGESNAAAAGATAAPTSVTVQTVAPQQLRLWNEFSGRLKAVDSANIRPEVSGRIMAVRFQDGQSVKAGDVLMVIDPRPFEAAVTRAEARIATAKATLQFTVADVARNATLRRTQAIAQREFDASDRSNNSAAAELLAAQADLKTAQVDLDHAYVKAPISGRVSRAELTVGNLVQSGSGAPLLTSIVSENGIYADFEVDEQTYLDTIRDSANGNDQEKLIPVELALPGDATRTFRGFIQNFDNQLDPASGTIRARAKFDNAGRTLVPGMFVPVRLASSRERSLVLVPDRAIGFDQSKKFVFTVSPANKVAYQEVELGRSVGGQRVVLKGLAAGDRVIVDGVQRVRADATVAPTEVAAAAQASGHRDNSTAQANSATAR